MVYDYDYYKKESWINLSAEQLRTWSTADIRTMMTGALKYPRVAFKNLVNKIGGLNTTAEKLVQSAGFSTKVNAKGETILVSTTKGKDRNELLGMLKAIQAFAKSPSSTYKGFIKWYNSNKQNMDGLLDDIGAIELDTIYRLFNEFRYSFGSVGSPKVLEAISRYVYLNGNLTYEELREALREDIQADRYDIADGEIIWDSEGLI